MFIPDDEKEGRKEALQKLMDLMGKETGKRLGGLKKPMSASIEIDKEDPEDDMSSMDDHDSGMMSDHDDDEPSDEDKAKIAELYHKYC